MDSKDIDYKINVETLLKEIKLLKEARRWRIINHNDCPDKAIPQRFVLVLDQDKRIYEAELTEFEDDDLVITYEWSDRDQRHIDGYYEITHWMPLPEMPEMEE